MPTPATNPPNVAPELGAEPSSVGNEIGLVKGDEERAAPSSRSFKYLRLKQLSGKIQKRRFLIVGLILGDILAIILAFVIASLIRNDLIVADDAFNIILTIIPIHIAVGLNNKAYQTNALTDLWKNISRGVVAFLLATSSMLLILFFFKTSAEFSRVMFGVGALAGAGFVILFRTAIFKFGRYYLGGSPYADLCIYDGVPFDSTNDSSIVASDYGIVAEPSDPEAVNRLGHLVIGIDCLVVHCAPEKREAWVFMLRTVDVKSELVLPELDAIKPLAIKNRNGRTGLLMSAGQLRWDQKLLKRVFDITVVLLSVPISIPVLLLTAVSIKVDSKGPVLFVQNRIGVGNRPFKILKFRSMRTDASDLDGDRSTSRDDDRITRVGKFIRRTSIDELPQLFNVLIGNMSLVGPRPHASGSRAENELFWDIDQRYWHRHVVTPGLTGLAQIRGYRGATEHQSDLSNRLQSDLEYVATWSLWNDIKIFLKTFLVIFHKNAF